MEREGGDREGGRRWGEREKMGREGGRWGKRWCQVVFWAALLALCPSPQVTEPVEWSPLVALTFSSPQVGVADPPSLGTLTCALDVGRALLKEQVCGRGSLEGVYLRCRATAFVCPGREGEPLQLQVRPITHSV